MALSNEQHKSLIETIKSITDPEPVFIFYHFDVGDRDAEILIRLLLREAKPYVDLGKGRAIMHHKAHIPNGQDHLHFRVKGSCIAAINKDGSAHDQSHGKTLQKWAMDGARAHYPDFVVPPDGLIEQLFMFTEDQVLHEAMKSKAILASPELMQLAEQTVVQR
ncbi:hypothetical protein HXX25_05545 [Hyphobacterium sp. CCMP332]|uniref:hypothetical protein n=1 Tax=Hyphobacterium sp. CCMP332 TaxID=2749086 RepID=UPI0016501C8D|nr:hypothetical protein [Hyphobacterium sp. CCMP332]QNL18856.1 hypothetical protein HXX25_05545 [Hyphobacterium sp. CCMP332]